MDTGIHRISTKAQLQIMFCHITETVDQQSQRFSKKPAISLKRRKIGLTCYEIQYMWTARSTETETETETGLDRYVMLGARWLTEY